jgi:hypothetical protein
MGEKILARLLLPGGLKGLQERTYSPKAKTLLRLACPKLPIRQRQKSSVQEVR